MLNDKTDPTDSDGIRTKGARVHNLKNIAVDIPEHRFAAITDVSGAGKSSLVFDTIYTKAQHQLIENCNAFTPRRLPKSSRPISIRLRTSPLSSLLTRRRWARTCAARWG